MPHGSRGRHGTGGTFGVPKKRIGSNSPMVIQTSITNDNQIIEEIVDANGEEPLYCMCRQVATS
jgi:hypothetical protein